MISYTADSQARRGLSIWQAHTVYDYASCTATYCTWRAAASTLAQTKQRKIALRTSCSSASTPDVQPNALDDASVPIIARSSGYLRRLYTAYHWIKSNRVEGWMGWLVHQSIDRSIDWMPHIIWFARSWCISPKVVHRVWLDDWLAPDSPIDGLTECVTVTNLQRILPFLQDADVGESE